MISKLEDGVLDELYDERSEKFEEYINNKFSEDIEKIGTAEEIKNLQEFVNELFKNDEVIIKKINTLIRKIETALFSEVDFWCRKYYKLGFCDANILKREVKDYANMNNDIDRKSFFDDYSDDFFEYVEDYKRNCLMKKPEYKKLIKKIRMLKEKNSKVTELVEDGKVETLSVKELKVMQKLLKLNRDIDIIEQKELFRLGMKEILVYLEDMDMISI